MLNICDVYRENAPQPSAISECEEAPQNSNNVINESGECSDRSFFTCFIENMTVSCHRISMRPKKFSLVPVSIWPCQFTCHPNLFYKLDESSQKSLTKCDVRCHVILWIAAPYNLDLAMLHSHSQGQSSLSLMKRVANFLKPKCTSKNLRGGRHKQNKHCHQLCT